MEQSPPREANSSTASQEIPLILWNPKVYRDVYHSPPQVLILSQTNAVHDFPSHSQKINFNIIFPPSTRFSSRYLSHRSPDQNQVCISFLSHTCHMLWPAVHACLTHWILNCAVCWAVMELRTVTWSEEPHKSKQAASKKKIAIKTFAAYAPSTTPVIPSGYHQLPSLHAVS